MSTRETSALSSSKGRKDNCDGFRRTQRFAKYFDTSSDWSEDSNDGPPMRKKKKLSVTFKRNIVARKDKRCAKNRYICANPKSHQLNMYLRGKDRNDLYVDSDRTSLFIC